MRQTAAFLIFLASPLAAQVDDVMTDATCAAIFPDVSEWGDEAKLDVDNSGWCHLKDASGAFDIGTLRIRMPNPQTVVNDGTVPASLRLRLDDVRARFSADDPGADIFQNVFGGLDQELGAAVDYSWDAETGRLTLNDASLRSGDGVDIGFSGILEKIDISTNSAITESVSQTELTTLTLQAQFDGSFSVVDAVSTVVLFLFGNSSPQSDGARVKTDMLVALPSIPEDNLASQDAAALKDFVEEWPRPVGQLEMTMISTRGITFSRVIGVIPDGFEDTQDLFGFFPDVTLSVSWDPTP